MGRSRITKGDTVEPTHAKGPDFEREVESLLTLKGYSVQRNQLISGTQIDLVARKDDQINNLCLIVECADRDAPIGVELVKQKASVLLTTQDSRFLYRLLFVSRNGFTAEAKAFENSHPGVVLLTPTDLENQLVDFTPYANWYFHNFERSLGMFKEGQLYDHYVELTGRDEHSRLIPTLTHEIKEWLADESNNLIFLLGEFGSGKTSFCRQLVYHLLQERYRGARMGHFIPVLINLRDYRNASNIQQVVTDTLVNQYGISLPSFLAFERVCSGGAVFLLLDGFDEMADRSDRQTLVQCFGQIYLLANLNTKVIVTCRSNVFHDNSDIIALLKQFSINIPITDSGAHRVVQLTLTKQGRVLFVERLNERQVREFIEKRFGANAESVIETIKGVHDLSDLATRPVLLDMILRTLPELVKQQRRINSAALYDHYTARWTARDEWRVTTPLNIRQEFCDDLAWAMHNRGIQEVEYSFLEMLMLRCFEGMVDSENQLERFKHDIITCSFLASTGQKGSFRFAHKSFVEFLVARKIVNDLKRGAVPTKPEVKAKEPADDLVRYLVGPSAWSPINTQPFAFSDFSKLYVGEDRSLFAYTSHYLGTLVRGTGTVAYSPLKFDRPSREAPLGMSSDEAIKVHIESQISQLFGKRHTSQQAEKFGITEEIATFGIEYLETTETALGPLVEKLRDTAMVDLLADLLRLSKATTYLATNAEFMKGYVVSGPLSILKAAFCSAMSRFPKLIELSFVAEARRTMDPGDWSYFLFELANQRQWYAEILKQCAQLSGLRYIDKVICRYGTTAWQRNTGAGSEDISGETPSTLSRQFVEDLLAADDPKVVSFGITLCGFIGLADIDLAEMMLEVVRRVTERGPRQEAVAILETLTGDTIWQRVRLAWSHTAEPELKTLLRGAEKRIRDSTSAEKNRVSWNISKADQALRARMWRSLRQ